MDRFFFFLSGCGFTYLSHSKANPDSWVLTLPALLMFACATFLPRPWADPEDDDDDDNDDNDDGDIAACEDTACRVVQQYNPTTGQIRLIRVYDRSQN